MDSIETPAEIPEPNGLDQDPSAYLKLPRFHQSLDFDFPVQSGEPRRSTVTYAFTAAPSPSARVLVFWNGMSAHRLVSALFDGYAAARDIRLLTIDKPGAGGSEKVELASRTRWAHAALIAVLDSLDITAFSLLSHSDGVIYALYTLLNLPDRFTVHSWILSGPYIPPKVSGSLLLSVATAIPSALTGTFGSIVGPVNSVLQSVGGAFTWSTGQVHGLLKTKQKEVPQHKKSWSTQFFSRACADEILRITISEAKQSIGQEALLCLHGGKDIWGFGEGTTEGEVLTSAFEGIIRKYPPQSERTISMQVFYGADDELVPKKGRNWLKELMERTGCLAKGQGWTEVLEAGHDDILFLEDSTEAMISAALQ